MNYLSQLIITVPTYNDIYSLKFLSELCALQLKLSESIHKFDQFTPYRSIWHVANYFACLAPESRVNCSYLTLDDVRSVRFDIEACATHRNSIINCRFIFLKSFIFYKKYFFCLNFLINKNALYFIFELF